MAAIKIKPLKERRKFNFFHGIISSKRRSNAIIMINVNGIQVEGADNVTFVVFNHFLEPFSWFSNFSVWRIEGILLKPFSLEEVKLAIWDCDSLKTQDWDARWDICNFFTEFHCNGNLTRGINSIIFLSDFRPIYLVGCLYKNLSKVLANQ